MIFKMRAYELMADKGYNAGFIPYASSQYLQEARDQGLSTITESFVLHKIYGDRYQTWADVKKAQYQERIAKVNRLKPISITYLGQTVNIISFTQLQTLMDEAVAWDIENNVISNHVYSHVHALKAAVYNAYLMDTDDFQISVYQ